MKRPQYRPTPEYRYWLFDPEGNGMTYYQTVEERDSEAKKAIDAYLDMDGDGWAEEVEMVAVGEVTHSAQAVDKQMRPADEDLDEAGCDGEGTPWPDEMSWRGNYTLTHLRP